MISMKNKISPIGLFFLLYISRVVISVTIVQPLTYGSLSTDMLVSIALGLLLTLVFCLPVVFCYKTRKNPFDVKWLGFLYAVFFIFASAVNIGRFSYFASTMLNPEVQAWVFALIIILCAFYCSSLGVEALTRFSAFGFFMIVLGMLSIFALNFKEYQEINLYPVINNSKLNVFKNALILSTNTNELAIFLCLADRVNGRCVKAFVSSLVGAMLSIFLLILFMIGVMGDSTSLYSFPVYTMFQVTKLGTFERLDVLHISFWIVGIFIKTVLLMYCAALSVKTKSNKLSCAVTSVLTLIASIAFIQKGMGGSVIQELTVIPFFVFCVFIPFAVLIFKKRSPVDELAKKL